MDFQMSRRMEASVWRGEVVDIGERKGGRGFRVQSLGLWEGGGLGV